MQSARYAAIWRLIRYASSYTSSLRRGLRRLETNDLRRPGLWRIFLPARFVDKSQRETHIFDKSYKQCRWYAEMWRVTDLKTWYESVARSLPYCSKIRRDKRFSMKRLYDLDPDFSKLDPNPTYKPGFRSVRHR